MTNYQHNEFTKAINEYAYDLPHDVEDIDEALEYLDYDQILSCYFQYYQAEYGCMNFGTIKKAFDEFYDMYQKTNNDLNIY